MPARRLPANYHTHEYGGVKAPTPIWLWPAYMALPFLRTPLGYETVSPRRVIWYTIGLFCCHMVAAHLTDFDRLDFWLLGFNIAYPALALPIWGYRWWRQGRPGEPHSTEAGYSWLAWYTRLPVALTEVFVVPLVLAGLAYAILDYLPRHGDTSWWLVLTAASLFILGAWEHRRSSAQRRALNDDMVRAGLYGERMEASAAGQPNGPSTSYRGKEAPGGDFADLA